MTCPEWQEPSCIPAEAAAFPSCLRRNTIANGCQLPASYAGIWQ